MWVFGYGSLVWRPDFTYATRRPASVHGWARRFWQGSPDHRGTPDAPGRVVTLIRAASETCAGMAYRLRPADAPAILRRLDHREKGGYERHTIRLEFSDGETAVGLVYVATAANENYLGPAATEAIASQVLVSRGPSGPNVEYVLRLAEALRAIGARDPHVAELEALLLRE